MGQAVTMKPSSCYKSFTGGISVKFMDFTKKMRGKDHRRIICLEKKDIQESEVG